MSEIKVDTLTGKTTANDITVTVGATATMSLEQGLAKAWGNASGDGTPVLDDSFNTTSLTDDGVGTQTYSLTNSMNSADFSGNGTPIETGFAINIQILGQSSSNSFQLKTHNASGSGADSDGKNYTIHGDLA